MKHFFVAIGFLFPNVYSHTSLSEILPSFLLLMLLHCGVLTCFGQPDTIWTRTYGEPNDEESAYSVQATDDGGFIVGGFRTGSVAHDVWLVKTDEDGDTLWTLVYGGSSYDDCYSVRQTVDGRFILAGQTGGDILLMRVDRDGSVLWEHSYDFNHLGYDQANDVQATEDGGYILCGRSDNGLHHPPYSWLMKTDSIGTRLWSATYDDGYEANAVEEINGGGYIIAGETFFGAGESDAHIIRTDSMGQVIWNRYYGGSSGDEAFDVKQTSDGGFIASGIRDNSWAWLLRLKADGDTVWTHRYRFFDLYSYLKSVLIAADGGFVAGGELYGGIVPDTQEALLTKVDSIGTIVWAYRSGTQEVSGKSIDQTQDGGYVLAGNSYHQFDDNMYVIRFTPALPHQVGLEAPGEGELVTADSVVLVWHRPNLDIDRYWIEGDTDSLFSTPFIDSLLTDTTYLLTPLHHNTLFWWKVRAHNLAGWGPFSEVRNFFVYQEIPVPPLLLDPPNGAVGVSTTPTVVWNPSLGSQVYSLQVSDTPDFTNIVLEADGIDSTSFGVQDLQNNLTYYWRVRGENDLGVSEWSEVWSFTTLVTDVKDKFRIPDEFSLGQNYPNPFNPTTTIRYSLPNNAHVRLEVFNTLGQRVASLVDEAQVAGYYQALFQNDNLASGVYLYRLVAGEFSATRKLLLLK